MLQRDDFINTSRGFHKEKFLTNDHSFLRKAMSRSIKVMAYMDDLPCVHAAQHPTSFFNKMVILTRVSTFFPQGLHHLESATFEN